MRIPIEIKTIKQAQNLIDHGLLEVSHYINDDNGQYYAMLINYKDQTMHSVPDNNGEIDDAALMGCINRNTPAAMGY